SNVDSGHQEEVSHIENNSSGDSIKQVCMVGLADVANERKWPAAVTAQSKTPKDASQENANHVIPIKQLEGVTGGQLHGVGPGPPAQHAPDHKEQGSQVCFRLIQAPSSASH